MLDNHKEERKNIISLVEDAFNGEELLYGKWLLLKNKINMLDFEEFLQEEFNNKKGQSSVRFEYEEWLNNLSKEDWISLGDEYGDRKVESSRK